MARIVYDIDKKSFETKKPVLLDEESEVRKFVIETVYHRDDINFEYLPIASRFLCGGDEIYYGDNIRSDIRAFCKALDYLGVKYELSKRKVNESF